MINIPPDVQNWLKTIFRECDLQATAKLDRNPFSYEEHLDMSIIDTLLQESSPVRFGGDWTVHINTHFLGHNPMLRNFEVADLGFLVMFRTAKKLVRSKVALLQSKRLYPESVEPETDEELQERYMHGFGGLLETDNDFSSLIEERTVTFTKTSRYKALRGNSEQRRVIDEYEASTKIPIYYLFYNPSVLPHSVNVPVSVKHSDLQCAVGTRIVPARNVHKIIGRSGGSPSYADLAKLQAPFIKGDTSGWPLEKFVVDLLLQCKVGRMADVRDDPGLYRIFYRRSGPIAAALSVTIDAPSGFDWTVEPDPVP